LAVDPGLNSAGYAWWGWSEIRVTLPPARVGLVKPKRSGALGERMQSIDDGVWAQRLPGCSHRLHTHLVVEMPHYQENAAAGFGWKTGDLQKLTLLVGYLVNHNWGAVTLATPRDWKGQLPKPVIIERITNRLGERACVRLNIERDAWDAVGIGLWAMTGKV
jgi:hypothetical protein